MPYRTTNLESQQAFTYDSYGVGSNQDLIQAFKHRQEADYRRFNKENSPITRRTPFRDRYQNSEEYDIQSKEAEPPDTDRHEGEEAWQNSEGERLKDFGLDEEAEFYDEEDDIPLSQLLLRRRQNKSPELNG